MDLKQYEQRKFALAEIIRAAQAVDTRDSELLTQTRELHARLAEDRFQLMVVGRFSRGKSTLVNAILGKAFLPTGIVPLTSVITTIRYGSRTGVVVHFTDSGLDREVPLARLSDYVTQKENPGNSKHVAYVELQFPSELLRRGLFFVDSPGLGSPVLENTQTTERFLPQADAFILVTSYDSAFSEEEERILQRIRNSNKKINIIVNKQDAIGAADRDEAMRFICERLDGIHFAEPPKIFSLSAWQALEARLHNDQTLLAESGIRAFEAELMRFLTEERAHAFLINMYERTLRILANYAHPGEEADRGAKLGHLIDRLRNERADITGEEQEVRESISIQNAYATYALAVDPKSGCRICGTVLDAVFKFLSKYQYDLTVDTEVQREHASRGGFCLFHTWQYEGLSSPQGVCEAYPRLVHKLAAELARAAQSSEEKYCLSGMIALRKTCPACQVRDATEMKSVKEMAETARQAIAGSTVPACCLPHLILTGVELGDGAASQSLLNAHAILFERTSEDLQRYALKHDALQRHLTSEEERQASRLALLLLAGHRSLSAPWGVEYLL